MSSRMPDMPDVPGVPVLHADPSMLVLDKPAGLLSVPGRGPDKQDCLSARVQAVYHDALIVHRLDMATSGIVVMARGIDAQRRLSGAFERRLTHKRYLALVAGHLPNPLPDNGWNTIDLPLMVDWLNRPRSIVQHTHGKSSLTRWRLAQPTGEDLLLGSGMTTRLELEPVTGRSHQLRVHLQAIGHPIAGDPLYADPEQQSLAPRLMLHACMLELPHPVSGERLRFDSTCPF